MQLRYLPWGVAGFACLAIAPGTPLWVVPFVAGLAHMGYDVAPEMARSNGRLLLTAARATPEKVRQLSDTVRSWRGEGGPTESAPSAAPAGQPQRAAQAAQRPERAALLDLLDEQPHRLIIGHSRGGKTSLIHELATGWAQQGARVVVCDPDMLPGMWPGCRAVGGGDNLEAMKQVLDLTAAEVGRRRQRRAEGQRRFTPIHVVIDEAQDVLPHIDGGLELFEDIARRGAKLGISMTVGVQDRQKATLKLDGKTHLLNNLTTVDVVKGRDGRRVAVIKDPVEGTKVQHPIPELPDPESFASAPPRPAMAARPAVAAQPYAVATGETEKLPRSDQALATGESADTLLASLLAEGGAVVRNHRTDSEGGTAAAASERTTPASGAVRDGEPPYRTSTEVRTGSDGVTHIVNNVMVETSRRRAAPGPRRPLRRASDRRYSQVRDMIKDGKSGNEICKLVTGERRVVLAMVRRAKAELGVR